jgi:hypothetical protein
MKNNGVISGSSGNNQVIGHSLVDWDWSDLDDDVSINEGDPWGDILAHNLSNGTGDFFDDFSVESVGFQEGHSVPQNIFSESYFASLGNIPDARKRRAKKLKDAKLKVVSEEDYDNPIHQKLVTLLRLRAKAILEGHERASEYLRWFFVSGVDSEIDFETSVRFLGAEPYSVRLKMQSYLFMNWVVLNEPISFFVAPPQEELIGKALYYAGMVADFAVKSIWEWPSISVQVLSKKIVERGFSQKVAIATIEHLLESKLVVEQSDNLYVVSHYGKLIDKKNPWK